MVSLRYEFVKAMRLILPALGWCGGEGGAVRQVNCLGMWVGEVGWVGLCGAGLGGAGLPGLVRRWGETHSIPFVVCN